MVEAHAINTDPVPNDQLVDIERFDESYSVPGACVDCAVLTTKTAAQAIGIIVRTAEVAGQGRVEDYSPATETKKSEAKQELNTRARNATSGACRFIIHQSCWRLATGE
jgi:hypothetical protein